MLRCTEKDGSNVRLEDAESKSDYAKIFRRVRENNLTAVDNDTLISNFKNMQHSLLRVKDQLASAVAQETGKPIKFCLAEVYRCIKIIDDAMACLATLRLDSGTYSTLGLQIHWYRRKLPIGLVLGFTPFSSPYSSFVHKLVASLIYRNGFICKPSPKAERCTQTLYSILKGSCTADIAQSFAVLAVSDNKIAEEMLTEFDYDCLLFTGKSTTASQIKSIIGRKRAVFETGSSALTYIGESADLQHAVKNILKGAFSQSGMRCVAAKNVFVSKQRSKEFLHILQKQLTTIVSGNELELNTDVGPIFDKEILAGLVSYIAILQDHQYEIVAGGMVRDTNLLEPTILLDKGGDMASVQEAYGPLLCVHEVNTLAEIPIIYLKRSSINTSIYTNDIQETRQWLEHCTTSGSIFINHGPTERIDSLPFGGMHDENEGKEGFAELMNILTKDQVIFNKI